MREGWSLWWRWPAAAVLAAAFGAVAWWRRGVYEDAFYFLRIVDVFLHGGGLAYNPGERFEANTDFLWTLLLILGPALGGPALGADPVRWMWLAGVAVYLATLLVTYALARLLLPTWGALLALAVLGTHRTFTDFAVTGFGIGLLALAGVCTRLALWRFCRHPDAADGALLGGALSFMALCRLDAAVLGLPVVCCVLWLLWRRAGDDPGVRAAAALALGIPSAACAALLLWKWAYYGDILPAPFYIKGPDAYAGVDFLGSKLREGVRFTLGYWKKSNLVLALGAAGGLWLWFRSAAAVGGALAALLPVGARAAAVAGGARRPTLPVLLTAAAMSAAWHAYVVRSGGDIEAYRLYAAQAPMLAVLLAYGLARLPRGLAWAVVLAAAAISWVGTGSEPRAPHSAFAADPSSGRLEVEVTGGPGIIGQRTKFRDLGALFASLGDYPDEIRVSGPGGGLIAQSVRLPYVDPWGFTDSRIGRANPADLWPPPDKKRYFPGHQTWAFPMLLARLGVNLVANRTYGFRPDFDIAVGHSYDGGAQEAWLRRWVHQAGKRAKDLRGLPPRESWAMLIVNFPGFDHLPDLRFPADSQMFVLERENGRHWPVLYFNRNATIDGILDARGIERFDVYPR